MSRLVAAMAVSTLLALASAQGAAAPELRACWVSRFEWPQGSESATRAKITTIMNTLAANNFNAVLFQVRGECDTLYPSPYEPWAPQFDFTDPGWDPMAFAIAEAHRNGLEFHAYINTHTIASTTPPAQTTPQHIYNLHGPNSSDSWAIHDESGTPQGTTDGYVWMSPGVPAAEAWTRQQIMYVVENYDVDGVHFDRIRVPAPEYSHDPVSEARFAGVGNPDGEDWGGFMRAQITRQLRRTYAQVMEVKPHVNISSAPFGICRRVSGGYQGFGTESYSQWYQDSFGWMQSHVMDSIFPQIYWQIGSSHPYEVLLKDFLDRDGGRHIYPGSITSNDYIAQLQNARSQGALGTTNFSYNSMDFSLYNTVYAEPAEIPEMPWKTNPTTGIVLGTVTDFLNANVIDASVTIDGRTYTHLSGGDGLYGILDIEPGTHTISGFKDGVGSDSETVTVAAGDVLRVNLKLTTSLGVLKLDKAVYRLGEEVLIKLTDSDLVSESSVSVAVTSDAETTAETINLAAVSPGSFEGAVTLGGGPPSADGILQVRQGGAFSVSYADAFDGTGARVTTADATVDEYVIIHDEKLDTDPEWTTEGMWQFGVPTGLAGDHGNPDPTSGYSGPNVYGYNLAGGYSNAMTETEWLTSVAVDCSSGTATRLEFRRWLQVEQNRFDKVFIQASNNGTDWTTVWENQDDTIDDTSWNLEAVDISAIADAQPAVQVRWGLGPTDGGWTYAGWNLDDIQILQIPADRLDEGWALY